MRTSSYLTVACALALGAAFCVAGCATPVPEPRIASSAAEPGYAVAFPDLVQDTIKRFTDADDEAKKIDGNLPMIQNDLTNPPWQVVEKAVAQADEAGRSQAYVDGVRGVIASRKFVSDEGDELGKKAAGAGQYVVSKKQCDVDVTGPVIHSLKEGTDKALERRLRAHNEGQAVLDRYREALGKKNADDLEKRTDEVAWASYLVHVVMVEQKLRLRAMIDEAQQAKKTLDDAAASERAYQTEAGHSEAEKQASRQRVQAIDRARASFDGAINQARGLPDAWQQRIEQAQQRHAQAVQSLLTGVRSKKGAATK